MCIYICIYIKTIYIYACIYLDIRHISTNMRNLRSNAIWNTPHLVSVSIPTEAENLV